VFVSLRQHATDHGSLRPLIRRCAAEAHCWRLLSKHYLNEPVWAGLPDYAEVVDDLVRFGQKPLLLELEGVLKRKPWASSPALLKLTGGEPPTLERALVRRRMGEEVKRRMAGKDPGCLEQVLKEMLFL
jgi:hypothetical protein